MWENDSRQADSIKKIVYRTLDDVTLQKAAQNDSWSFIETSADTLIIDEIQKSPLLLPSIKQIVDQSNFYLLAADIRKLPQVSENLAVRIRNFYLRALSYGEILGNQLRFIKRLFNRHFANQGIW